MQPGEQIVDVGCGAGIDNLLAARMVGPGGSVIGVDMTPAMLEKAHESGVASGMENLEFREGHGEALPVADGWADVGAGFVDFAITFRARKARSEAEWEAALRALSCEPPK